MFLVDMKLGRISRDQERGNRIETKYVFTVRQVSRQSRASRARSCQVRSSSFPPFSWACSAIRKKHQPSRYHASTSWSSDAMIPCRTRRAGVNRESSRKSFTSERREGMGGNLGSSKHNVSHGVFEINSWPMYLLRGLSKKSMLAPDIVWHHPAVVGTIERRPKTDMPHYYQDLLGVQD